MKTIFSLMLAAFLFVGFTSEKTSQVTVKGKLIDTKCYGMMHENHTNDHMVKKGDKMMKMPSCATACASMGIPAGVLEGGKKDGNVHVVIAPAGVFAEHMDKEVRITGEAPYAGAIMPGKVEVKNDKGKWVEVDVATMM